MEIAIVVFIGVWLSAAGVLGYLALRRDFKDYIKKKDTKRDKQE